MLAEKESHPKECLHQPFPQGHHPGLAQKNIVLWSSHLLACSGSSWGWRLPPSPGGAVWTQSVGRHAACWRTGLCTDQRRSRWRTGQSRCLFLSNWGWAVNHKWTLPGHWCPLHHCVTNGHHHFYLTFWVGPGSSGGRGILDWAPQSPRMRGYPVKGKWISHCH